MATPNPLSANPLGGLEAAGGAADTTTVTAASITIKKPEKGRKKRTEGDDIVAEAKEAFNDIQECESENRKDALDDVRFARLSVPRRCGALPQVERCAEIKNFAPNSGPKHFKGLGCADYTCEKKVDFHARLRLRAGLDRRSDP